MSNAAFDSDIAHLGNIVDILYYKLKRITVIENGGIRKWK